MTSIIPSSTCTLPSNHSRPLASRDPAGGGANLGGETVEEGEPEVDEREGKVLEEEVAQELAHADVGPAAVHQQEALQVAELGEGVVAGHHRLHALLAGDPHPDVRGWGAGQE